MRTTEKDVTKAALKKADKPKKPPFVARQVAFLLYLMLACAALAVYAFGKGAFIVSHKHHNAPVFWIALCVFMAYLTAFVALRVTRGLAAGGKVLLGFIAAAVVGCAWSFGHIEARIARDSITVNTMWFVVMLTLLGSFVVWCAFYTFIALRKDSA